MVTDIAIEFRHCRVWQEWRIDDNKFVSMMMYEGDNCGLTPRQTEVSSLLLSIYHYTLYSGHDGTVAITIRCIQVMMEL